MPTYKYLLFGTNNPTKEQVESALDRAWKTRNFEIERYWGRSLYFWGFILAIFVAYAAVKKTDFDGYQFVVFMLLSLGVLFSCAFYLSNRGSKFWQENWEAHIDILEKEVECNIYKVLLMKDDENICIDYLLSSANYSVSRINTFVSLCLFVFWASLFLIEATSFINLDDQKLYAIFSVFCFILTCVAICLLWCKCLSSFGRERFKDFDNKDENCIYKYHYRKIFKN